MARLRCVAAALFVCGLMISARAAPVTQADQQLRTQQLQDLAVFRSEIFLKDRSYTPRTRRSAGQLLSRLHRDAGTVSRASFALRLGEVLALARNGHTEQKAGPLRQRMNRSPLRYFIGSDGAHVVHSAVPSVRVGARVQRFGTMTLNEIEERLARYASGNRGHREWMLYAVLESPELLHALGATDAADQFSVTIDGDRRVSLSALPADPVDAEKWWGDRELALAGQLTVPTPLYLKEPERGYRLEVLPQQSLVYIQFRQNHDDGSGESLSSFSSRVERTVNQQKPCFVVVDQRLNYGGDLNLTRDLMKLLPGAVAQGGHIYAITGGKTFSSGISSLGYLKQAAGNRLTIVGQPIGDDLDFWAEGDRVTLPNSGLMFGFATERHMYNRPCRASHCHRSIVEHPISVADLNPQVPVQLRYSDYSRGIDASMSWVSSDVQSRRSACSASNRAST
jgi:hypothetical protein